MITRSAVALIVVLLGAPLDGPAIAQEPTRPVTGAKPTVTALMVEVTISRHLGDKLISSTPYQLSVIPENRSSLRMGGDVPVPSVTFAPAQEGKPANPLTSYGYRSIGTNIDVIAGPVVDGQYRLTLTIEENSIYPLDAASITTAMKATGAPAFRSFKSNNTIALRDGQSLDYTMATDRISGEVYRVNIKLAVVK